MPSAARGTPALSAKDRRGHHAREVYTDGVAEGDEGLIDAGQERGHESDLAGLDPEVEPDEAHH